MHIIVLILIMVAFGVFLVYPLLHDHIGPAENRFIKQKPKESLSHSKIITAMAKLGHEHFEGVCYGFIMNWAVEVALQNEDSFYLKLQLLRHYQDALCKLLKSLSHKRRLNDDERILNSLPELFRKIAVAQNPTNHQSLFGKLVWQPDVADILKAISPAESRIRHVFYKTHSYSTREEATNYFNLLKKIDLDSKVAVMISSGNHSMGLRRVGDLWQFININNLFAQDNSKPYFEFNTRQLVNELYRVCTHSPLSRRLTVSIDFIAVENHPRLAKYLSNVFPIFPIEPKISSKEKFSLFALAALQGDLLTVFGCLKSGLSIFSHHEMEANSPILIAICQGRREIVNSMIAAAPHRINYRRKKDLTTLLHLACSFSSSEIISDLLRIKGIKVDMQDSSGRTPLMMACTSKFLKDDPEPFKLLLERGASLMVKDNSGLSAIDYAREYEHDLALELFTIEITQRSWLKLDVNHLDPSVKPRDVGTSVANYY